MLLALVVVSTVVGAALTAASTYLPGFLYGGWVKTTLVNAVVVALVVGIFSQLGILQVYSSFM